MVKYTTNSYYMDNLFLGAEEMSQQLRALAAFSEVLGLIPNTIWWLINHF